MAYGCDICIFFVRMRLFLSASDTVDIKCLEVSLFQLLHKSNSM